MTRMVRVIFCTLGWTLGCALGWMVLFSESQLHAGPRLPELIVYTHDSFLAPDGIGREVFALFEKQYSCRIKAVAVGDGGQLVTRLQSDAQRGKPLANLVVGVDQQLWGRIKPWAESWGGWTPENWSKIPTQFKTENGFLPFDYSPLSFIADSKQLRKMNLKLPESLSGYLRPEWKRNLLLQDPRTSTPGLSFLIFTREVLEEKNWVPFWKGFSKQWLTLTPGWEGAYQLFLSQEAPLVWSYLTSQAYHAEKASPERPQGRYQAVLFKEGQPVQIEGVVLIKGLSQDQGTAEKRKLSQAFLGFMISREVQQKIPLKAWMLPVRKDVPLPESFKQLPQPKKLFSFPVSDEMIQNALSQWSLAIQ